MYIKNGIAYAGEQAPLLKISGVRPLDDFNLWVRFNNGEAKIFDFKPLLKEPGYMPLQDGDILPRLKRRGLPLAKQAVGSRSIVLMY